MNLVYKRLYLVIAALLVLGYSVSFAQVPVNASLAKVQELTRSNGSEPETLDPSIAESVPAHNVLFDIFEGLVASDAKGNLIPGLATSWKRVNPTTWQFFLRPGIKFSNGKAITASDFVYSFQRFVDPATASPYSSTYGIFLKNGNEVIEGKMPATALGVKAISPTILQVETASPYEYFLQILVNTQFTALDKATVEKYGKDWIKPNNIVTNGAYILREWQVNNKIVLEKNPNYYDAAKVTITKVTFLPIEDLNTDIKLFESGETDYVYQLPAGSAETLAKKYPNEFKNGPFLGLRYYGLNNTDPLLKDVRVRQALSMVIDRDLLASRVTADGQIPAYSVVVKGVAGGSPSSYDWVSWPMEKRVSYAKTLLVNAGVKPGTTLKLVYNTSDYHKKMAIFVASEWKNKLELNTELETLEFRVLLQKRHDLDYQVARNGWVADYNDVTTFLTLIRCRSTQNDNGNCNEEAEKLFLDAENQTSPAKRAELVNKGVALVMADYPIIPVLQYTAPRLVSAKVGGYLTENPLDKHFTKYLYIKAQ